MRTVTLVCIALVLASCSGDDTTVTSTTTSPLTTTSVATTETTVPPPPTTTSSIAEPQDDGPGESIGVTDKVTIVITDPEEDQ